MSTPDASHSLPEVLLAELSWIQARRAALQAGKVVGDKRLPATPQVDAWLPDLAETTDGPEGWEVFHLQQRALHADLCGLAISGGGIRSATFALGVLQGLALWGMLPRFDYLSTVSGGGYIGAWLSAWIARSGLATVERQLIPPWSGGGQRSQLFPPSAFRSGNEAQPESAPPRPNPFVQTSPQVPEIHHLRLYSNYLAPLRGLFSFDTWTLFAIYLRNLLLNQTVLALAMLLLFLLIRIVVEVFIDAHQKTGTAFWIYHLPAALGLAAAIGWGIRGAAEQVPRPSSNLSRGPQPSPVSGDMPRLKQRLQRYLVGVVLPWVLAAVCLSLLLVLNTSGWEVHRVERKPGSAETSSVWLSAMAAITGLFVGVNYLVGRRAGRRSPAVGLASAIAGLGGGLLLSLGLRLLSQFTLVSDAWLPDHLEAPATGHWAVNVVVACPPLTLFCITITNFLMLGFSGPELTELEREWWSSLNARLLQIALAWLALFGMAIHGTWLLQAGFQQAGASFHLITAGSLTWLALLLAGLAFLTRNAGPNQPASKWASLLPALMAPLFLLTIFLGMATVATRVFDTVERSQDIIQNRNGPQDSQTNPSAVIRLEITLDPRLGESAGECWPELPEETRHPGVPLRLLGFPDWTIPHWLLLIPLAALVYRLWRGAGDVVGVNTFSLQNMYANRLARCFLGASRVRVPDLTTNMDPGDDLPLARLFPGSQRKGTGSPLPETHWGPLHLVNGALNRKASSSFGENRSAAARHAETLQFLDRQAESFVFSPLFCGSESTGYCPTQEFAGNVTVGTAIAASGAAVSPNMGYHSSPAITALLTVFNFRLGSWFGNPGNPQTRVETNPSESAGLLLSELLGQTPGNSPYVYVSDGGHFENMGVYELIRRRCRFIVAVDSGTDPTSNDNLGRLIRQVRIDFGVGIELDMTPVTPRDDGLCAAHITVGRIHYGVTWDENDRPIGPLEDLETFEEADPVYRRELNQGILIWIKNSITGDESGDVLNYRAENPEFPYDPTLNQFFSEAQFESYRRLGVHSVTRQFQFPNGQRVALDLRTNHSTIAKYTTRELFEGMYNSGQPLLAQHATLFAERHLEFNAWLSQLRDQEQLQWLADEIFGSDSQREFAARQPRTPDQERAERLMAAEMFTLLEATFRSLDLRKNWRHPRYAGWAGQFGTWANSPTLRRHWQGDPQSSLPPLQTLCDPQIAQFVNLLFEKQHHFSIDPGAVTRL
ncbi:MAG: patatin-like phospholipase family protein [Planctomycetaceae bacterium]|jgi:hypothetical protein